MTLIHTRNHRWAGALVLAMLAVSMTASAQTKDDKTSKRKERAEKAKDLPAIIWGGTADPATLDITNGIGGKEHAPDFSATFTFLEEDMSESQPKFDVRDAQGMEWRVKLGEEAKPETAATRLVWAAGYFVDEDYYVDQLKVEGLPTLKRGQRFVSEGGVVHGARLERKPKDVKKLGTWSWSENPFIGTREFNGLRVMMALINNWDATTINNSIYAVGGERRYAVTDLGASFGKTGDSVSRSKGNMDDYVKSKFTDKVTKDYVDFVLHSRPLFLTAVDVHNYIHRSDVINVTRHIPLADAKWMGQRLGQLSDEQIRDCFRAAGYSPEEVEGYSKAVQERIAELNALGVPANSEAAK
jgi:hypothetical protein